MTIRFCSCREDVDALNAQQLRALAGEPRRFVAQDGGSPDVLAAACPARRTLDLKVYFECEGIVGMEGCSVVAAAVRMQCFSTSCAGLHGCRWGPR